VAYTEADSAAAIRYFYDQYKDQYGMTPGFLSFVFAIGLAESGLDPNAHGDTTLGGTGSWGLFMFYTGGGRGDGVPIEQLLNPYYQSRVNLPILWEAYKKNGGDAAFYGPNRAQFFAQAWYDGQGANYDMIVQRTPSVLAQLDAFRMERPDVFDPGTEFPAPSGMPSSSTRNGLMYPTSARPSSTLLANMGLGGFNPVAAVLGNLSAGDSALLDSLGLAPPVEDQYVTEPWGYDPNYPGAGDFHYGIDYGTGQKSVPVFAPMSGKVIQVGLDDGYGLAIRVQHPDGTTTLYGHLSSASVGVGDTVGTREQIAMSGGGNGDWRDGTSTGFHLHFAVMQDGQWVNPQGWLDEMTPDSVPIQSPSDRIDPDEQFSPYDSSRQEWMSDLFAPAYDPVAAILGGSGMSGGGAYMDPAMEVLAGLGAGPTPGTPMEFESQPLEPVQAMQPFQQQYVEEQVGDPFQSLLDLLPF
jgi:murein DD-endopeptidase MepM/ murein hydrolase activator NlpD